MSTIVEHPPDPVMSQTAISQPHMAVVQTISHPSRMNANHLLRVVARPQSQQRAQWR